MLKLHLGCGSRLLDGWLNVDLMQKEGITNLDLRQPLPYVDQEVSQIYSEHLIEHLPRHEGLQLLRECYRVLNKDSGIFRVSTPDLAYLVDAYIKGDVTRYYETGWMPRSKAQMVNEAMHEWGHLFLYDEQELITVMHDIGFKKIRRFGKNEGVLGSLESRPDCHDLILEAST